MRRDNFKAAADDDSLPVIVPRNDKAVVPITRARETAAQALGRNLARIAYDEGSRAFRFAHAAGT